MSRVASRIWKFILISLIFVTHAHAQVQTRSRVPLHSGMTESEVQAQWGEPIEKIEFEIKHQSTWRYGILRKSPATEIKFVDGHLSSGFEGGIENSKLAKGKNQIHQAFNNLDSKNVENAGKQKPRSFMALNNDKELNEVLKDVPNEPDGPAAPGAQSPVIGGVQPPNPAQFE